MTTKEQRDEWRKLKGEGKESAIGEYTPEEFWELLDEIDSLEKERGELRNALQVAIEVRGTDQS